MSSHVLDEIVEKLSHLSVLDMAALKKKLEEKWGVQAAVAVAAAPGGAAAAPAAEATEFKVILEGPIPDDKKISVIKMVREITGLGLKEAKEMVEGVPKDLKPNAVPKAEAEDIKKKIEAAGAKVKLVAG